MLLHMGEVENPVTSDRLAQIMRTNPVVIRRLMAGLRDRGFVRSAKGHGGGWEIARDLSAVTLRDVYDAIGAPPVFAIGNRRETPDCAVEQSVNAVLGAGLRDAEALLLSAFAKVSLAELSADFHRRLAQRPQHSSHKALHND